MSGQSKARQQLAKELCRSRRRVRELEAQLARSTCSKTTSIAGSNGVPVPENNRSPADANAEFRRAQEALRQSEQRLTLHFQQTPLAAIEWDLDFKVTKWNPGAERLFGYSEEEARGRHASLVVPESVRDHVDRIWNDLLVRKGGGRSTNVNVTKDGRKILCEWYNTPLVDAEGNVVAVASLVEDITERTRAELKLQHRRRTLRTLIDGSPESILLLDRSGTILVANTTTARRLHRPLEEIVGRTFYDILPQDVADYRRQCLEKVVHTGEPIRFDDVRFGRHIENAMYPVFDQRGKVITVAVLGIDQTDRERAQEALRKAHDELEQKVKERTAELAIFRQFAEASGRGFGMADLDGNITYANPTLCLLLGEEGPGSVLGRHITTYYPPDYRQRREEEILPALMRDGVWQGELTIVTRQGRSIPVLQSSFLIRDEQGQPFRLAVAIHDVTELKQAQAKLERERQSLRQLLQASDHERQTISSEIHDGLAQYLAAAMMQFETHDAMKATAPVEAAELYRAAVELVHRAHGEARRLISEVRPPIIDEKGLEVAIQHLVHERRRGEGICVDFEADVEFERLHPMLENDLYRIAQEALTNAGNHSKSKHFRIALVQEGQQVRMEIQDWGIGFDPESIRDGHYGLEGIRQRVRLLGGRLTIDSVPGSGTLLRVVVPVWEHDTGL